jgi:type IV fimbrial biogenesis protein FimT
MLEPVMKRRQLRGLTMIEVLVAIAIMAILAGLAAPPFREALAKARLEGAVSTFAIDVQYTRTEAIRAGNKGAATKAAATLEVDGSGTSYKVYVAPIADAAPDEPIKVVTLPDGVTFTPEAKIEFDGLRGTAINPKTVEAKSDATDIELKLSTNALGRVSLCTTKRAVAGYVAC